MKRLTLTFTIVAALLVAAVPPARSAPHRALSSCVDAALVLPVTEDRVREAVPATYDLVTTGTHAFLYVNTVSCPDGTAFQIVSVGVTPPGGAAAPTAPVGPGRRDHYVLSLSTSSPSLLSLLRRHGFAAARTKITFDETAGPATIRAVVGVDDTGFTFGGSFTRSGSPAHDHEHHYWQGAGGAAAEMRMDISMIDHPGVGRFDAHRDSPIARYGTEGADTTAFLNRCDIALTINSAP